MDQPTVCAVCGYVYSATKIEEIPEKLQTATAAFVALLDGDADELVRRPAPDHWSVLEYASHLRDVLLSLRERLILGLLVDNAVGTPIYRDERVDRGLYSLDTPSDLQVQLGVATNLVRTTISTMPIDAWKRKMTYSTTMPGQVDLAWVASQALHEATHHLGDIQSILG